MWAVLCHVRACSHELWQWELPVVVLSPGLEMGNCILPPSMRKRLSLYPVCMHCHLVSHPKTILIASPLLLLLPSSLHPSSPPSTPPLLPPSLYFIPPFSPPPSTPSLPPPPSLAQDLPIHPPTLMSSPTQKTLS